jgi:hypothetical protein
MCSEKTQVIFFLNVFNQWLVESMNAELTDTEGFVYYKTIFIPR